MNKNDWHRHTRDGVTHLSRVQHKPVRPVFLKLLLLVVFIAVVYGLRA